MKGDWFCPCLIFFLGGAWLAVSVYFATTNWLHVAATDRDYIGPGTCQLVQKPIRGQCEFESSKACRITLVFYGNISVPNERKRPAEPKAVFVPMGNGGGCNFRNCAKGAKWADQQMKGGKAKKNALAECWAQRKPANASEPQFILHNPAGDSKRNRIIFTVCAGIALLIVLGMVFVMCGLICRNCR